jgi:predicted acyltransferase
MLGLLADPFEGGIKKDVSTMSYYFVTNGLAMFMLIGFSIIIDYLRKAKWVQLLIDNGQNPMLAYAGGQIF